MLEILNQINNQQKSIISLDENIKEDNILELLKEITQKEIIKLIDIKPTRALKNAILSDIAETKKLEDPVFVYLREIRKIKSLELEEKELGRKIKNGDMEARQKFIKANLYLVVKIAKNKKYQGKGLELLDLVEEGTLGLLKAIDKYDPERKNKFSTYATWWIERLIIRAIYEKGRTISLTYRTLRKVNKIKFVQIKLFRKFGIEPATQEIAKELEIKVSEVEKFIIIGNNTLSLNFPVNESEDSILQDFIEDTTNSTPEENINLKIIKEKIDKILKTLKPRDEQIMRMRFGFDKLDDHTLQEIGDEFGVKKQGIYEIEKRIFAKLKKNPEIMKIAKNFFEG